MFHRLLAILPLLTPLVSAAQAPSDTLTLEESRVEAAARHLVERARRGDCILHGLHRGERLLQAPGGGLRPRRADPGGRRSRRVQADQDHRHLLQGPRGHDHLQSFRGPLAHDQAPGRCLGHRAPAADAEQLLREGGHYRVPAGLADEPHHHAGVPVALAAQPDA